MKIAQPLLICLLTFMLAGCTSPGKPSIATSEWSNALQANLERDVRTLAEEHPSRSILDPDRLEAAAAWLETRLVAMGYQVQSQPYEMPGPDSSNITVRNLFVEVPPTQSPARWLIIGAHYDTVRNTPGADDNASGVAGVLALAEYFRDRPQPVGLRFELYTNEETIRHGRQYMGSVRRARAAVEAGDQIIGAVILEMIGYYTGGPLTPQAQMFAQAVGVEAPKTDLFLGAVSWEPARPLAEAIARAWSGPVGVLVVLTPVGEPMAARSDHGPYLDEGIPALMLTDTAEFRNPHYHGPEDRVETLNFERMTEAVQTIRAVIDDLAEGNALSTGAARSNMAAGRFKVANWGSESMTVVAPGVRRDIYPADDFILEIGEGETIVIEGLAALRITNDQIVFEARRTSPPVRVTVPGKPGTGVYTTGATAEYSREHDAGLQIDGIFITPLARASGGAAD